MQRWEANAPRFRADGQGHYESYFVRANHPRARIAFWLRYTIFEPVGRGADAVGEAWAVVIDGRRALSAQSVTPVAQTRFEGSPDGLSVRIGEAILRDDATSETGLVRGAACSGGHSIKWNLGYAGGQPPLMLFPERWYGRRLPRAKALVPAPMAEFNGHVQVDGVELPVDGWIGSLNHNWGSQHTDEYAWGQVCGFDDSPATFLELATARIHASTRLRTPWLTPLVVRHEGRELRCNGLIRSLRATARYDLGGLGVDSSRWTFQSTGREDGVPVRVTGEFSAPHSSFVSLAYENPPGGQMTCHNTKVAHCWLRIERRGEQTIELHTANRAAFEVLTPAPATTSGDPVEPVDRLGHAADHHEHLDESAHL